MSQSAVAVRPEAIDFTYEADGQVRCKNQKGMTFFLKAEPPQARHAGAGAPTWRPVAPTKEVEVRRHAEPVPVARAFSPAPIGLPSAPQGAGEAPAPGAAPAAEGAEDRGWFKKLFQK